MADGVSGSGGRGAIGSGGGGICWDKLAGLSWVPRSRTLAAATGRVVDDCDGDALLRSAHKRFAVILSNLLAPSSANFHRMHVLMFCHNEVDFINNASVMALLAHYVIIYDSYPRESEGLCFTGVRLSVCLFVTTITK